MAKIVLTPLSAGDILQTEYAQQKWLVEDLIRSNTMTVISGAPGSYKTWAALDLAINAAAGTHFLGRFKIPEKHRVLILDKENYLGHIQERLKALRVAPDVAVRYLVNEALYLDAPDHVEGLLELIQKEKITLTVFDTLSLYHRGDENDIKQMTAVLRGLKKLVNAGVNVIFLHHHRKEPVGGGATANSLRGSSGIFAAVDTHYSLEYKQAYGTVLFTQQKMRQAPPVSPFAVKVISDKTAHTFELRYEGEFDAKKEKRDKTKTAILAVLDDTAKVPPLELASVEQICEFLPDFSEAQIRAALKELEEESNVIKEVRDHGKTFYKSMARVNEDIPF